MLAIGIVECKEIMVILSFAMFVWYHPMMSSYKSDIADVDIDLILNRDIFVFKKDVCN